METKAFLESVLSGTGHYCIFGSKKDGEIARRVQKFYPTIDTAYHTALNLAREGFDAYFALATYKTGESRKVANVQKLKAFFLDIDCGPDKDYPDQVSGIAALRQFCKTTSMPRPLMVNSGRGVHAYWPLTKSLPVDKWVPIAEQLKLLCRAHNLLADPSVTADAARILRVPDTYNFKGDAPLLVSVLGSGVAAVELDQIISVVGAPAKPTFTPPDDVTDALAGVSNYTNSFKLILQKTIAGKGCGQIQHVVEDRAELSEPMWRAGLSVAKFCKDADKAIHHISAGHPGYSADTTAQKVDLIKGPYTCAKFDEYHPGVCTSCIHWNKIKSPILLGREVREATEKDNVVEVPTTPELPDTPISTYTIPKYPEPYFRGAAGGVFKRAKDKEGDNIEFCVYHNDIYVTRRLRDPDVGESVVLSLHLPKDGVREFTVPLASILSRDEFRKHMAANGVAVLKMEDLMAYVAAWVNKLQATAMADEARRQFGWLDETCGAFIVGEREIRGNEVMRNPPAQSTRHMFPMFKTKGTLEGWKKMVNFYNRPGMEMHQYMIGMGFGSALMQFLPQCGAVFHAHSEDSGLGKTTAMQVGASIWGDPEQMMSRENDTHAAKMNRAEVFKNIFLPIDEMTNVHPKDASDFLYQITGGMQRNRQSPSANMERKRGDAWHMLVCSTANTSLLARVRMYKTIPKAEASRVLEYEAQPYKFDDKLETDQLGRDLAEHYGHACVPYIQYIINNVADVKALLYQTQTRIDKAANLSQSHRFWSAQAACTITGLMLAKRLGLLDFKVADIVAWLINVIKSAKEGIDKMAGTVEDMLNSYMAENYNNILRIKSTDNARDGIGDGHILDHLIIPDASPRMVLIARYEYDVKRLYLLPKPLREWCNKQQLNYAKFLEGLKQAPMNAVTKKVRMGKGTNMNLPPADTIMVDCTSFMLDEAVAEPRAQ